MSVAVTDDDTLVIFLEDESGFGFVEGLPGECAAEAAERLLHDLDSELPSTTRGWAEPLLRCPVRDHHHLMTTKANELARSVDLYCPQAPDVPLDRIDLGVHPPRFSDSR